MDARYAAVYRRYLEEALRADSPGRRILKTDAYNEAQGWPPPAGIAGCLLGEVTLLELDPAVIEAAKAKYPTLDVQQGDIRSLPFADGQFDVVLDFSTIDHIPAEDTLTALREYRRVLRAGGRLTLVCWCKYEDQEGAPLQAYHSLARMEGELKGMFFISFSEFLMQEPEGATLVLWRAAAVVQA